MIALDGRTTRLDAGIVDVVVLAHAPHGPGHRRASVSPPWRVLTMRRAAGVRCTGAWELVHGTVEAGETPADAARREVLEETGLTVERLYSITVNPFYLPQVDVVQLAMVFAAVVPADVAVTLGVEHDASAWLRPVAAIARLQWPREHDAVRYAMHLLRTGDAGAAEDVLHIKPPI
jgi:dihydroneopterin triphosphate diphosphatase